MKGERKRERERAREEKKSPKKAIVPTYTHTIEVLNKENGSFCLVNWIWHVILYYNRMIHAHNSRRSRRVPHRQVCGSQSLRQKKKIYQVVKWLAGWLPGMFQQLCDGGGSVTGRDWKKRFFFTCRKKIITLNEQYGFALHSVKKEKTFHLSILAWRRARARCEQNKCVVWVCTLYVRTLASTEAAHSRLSTWDLVYDLLCALFFFFHSC